MAAWHLEIRSKVDGRTLCAVDAEVRKVSDIDAVKSGDTVGILVNGESTAVGFPTVEEARDGGYELYRWPLNREGDPVVKQL